MAMKCGHETGKLFRAVPSEGRIPVTIGMDGKPKACFPNTVVLPETIAAEIRSACASFWFTKDRQITLEDTPWAVNTLGDADEYTDALIALDEAIGSDKPIFNHPRAVAMTRRDLSAMLLDGIPNLIVPKCIRLFARNNAALQEAFDASGFTYPVLIRPAASQTGQGLVKVSGPGDWPDIDRQYWRGKHLFMTQFVETRGEAGYRKIRVMCFDGEVFFHHVKHSSTWCIHHNTGEVSATDFADQEKHLIAELNGDPAFLHLVKEITNRSKMDFLGIDLGLRDDNQYVLFEANAAMTVVHDPSYYDNPIMMDRRARLHAPLEEAIVKAVSLFISGAGNKSVPSPAAEAFPPVRQILAEG